MAVPSPRSGASPAVGVQKLNTTVGGDDGLVRGPCRLLAGANDRAVPVDTLEGGDSLCFVELLVKREVRPTEEDVMGDDVEWLCLAGS